MSPFRTVDVPTNYLYLRDIFIQPEEDVLETDVSVDEGISVIFPGEASMPDEGGVRVGQHPMQESPRPHSEA